MLDNFIIEDNHVMVYVCIRTRVLDIPCAMVWRLVCRIYNETYHANITLVHLNCTLSWSKFDLQHNLLRWESIL